MISLGPHNDKAGITFLIFYMNSISNNKARLGEAG